MEVERIDDDAILPQREYAFLRTGPTLGGHPKPAIRGHLKTGQ